MKLFKNKKILIIFVSSILLISGVTSIIILNKEYKNDKKENDKIIDLSNENINTIILKDNLNFEINSDLTLLSLIDKKNKVKIVNEDEKIDTSILGEKEIVIKYLDGSTEKEYKFSINIIDTTSPVIEFSKELETEVGTEIDLLKDVKVTDNSKERINVIIDGKYDFQKAGEYKLNYVALDSSKNEKREEFVLKVIDKNGNHTQNNQNINTNNNIVNNNDNKQNNESSNNNQNNNSNKAEENNSNNEQNNKEEINKSEENTNEETDIEIVPEVIAEYKQDEAKNLFTIINNKRQQKGLSNLKWNSSLESSAKVRAKELVTSFSTTRPNQTSYKTAVTIKYISLYESIYAGSSNPNDVVNSVNALYDDYSDIGISLYYDSSSKHGFYWVVILAEVDNQVAEYRQNEANKMITLINNARKENGLGELKLNSSLESSAKVRSKELVSLYSHTRPNGSEFYTALTINYRSAGENIAAGQRSVEEVFNAWMNSPGHRANILNENYTDIGISWYYDPDSNYKYHWVQLFAGI